MKAICRCNRLRNTETKIILNEDNQRDAQRAKHSNHAFAFGDIDSLQLGEASVVVPIDKLSIVLTVAFSSIFLKEHLSRKAFIGLILIVSGTMLLLV